ncbi:unnamed protein product [Pleuronectes platessa]|uniref:Uncharacterized protein n=1 Tax=Pleuronectes platessa TaxID=8262 RepID=A0A9N7YIZ8_PLEPL|nr:unnamed protein product [Pleuronectes platessa]
MFPRHHSSTKEQEARRILRHHRAALKSERGQTCTEGAAFRGTPVIPGKESRSPLQNNGGKCPFAHSSPPDITSPACIPVS